MPFPLPTTFKVCAGTTEADKPHNLENTFRCGVRTISGMGGEGNEQFSPECDQTEVLPRQRSPPLPENASCRDCHPSDTFEKEGGGEAGGLSELCLRSVFHDISVQVSGDQPGLGGEGRGSSESRYRELGATRALGAR